MTVFEHLATGVTTICRCWAIRRRDGITRGFTDHDTDLNFAGIKFHANTGMTARAFHQSTGLSVDNSEAIGALSDSAIRDADIEAGRYDDAEITMWIVNWRRSFERSLRFSGTIGEISRTGESFRAELRGLTEGLNKPQGMVYQRNCSAVLGDRRCRIDLTVPKYAADLEIEQVADGKTFVFSSFPAFSSGWFERGLLNVVTGPGAGLSAHIKVDRTTGAGRRIVLWQAVRAELRTGDAIRISAGCNKRAETCKAKFGNFLNFRGFPAMPGEDWLMAYPSDRVPNDGGRL